MRMNTTLARLLQIEILEKHRSPYDAVAKLREMGLEYVPSVSSVYNHIARNDIGIQYGQTPSHPSRRKKTKEPVRRAFKNHMNTSVEDRPDLSQREAFGHWEMDAVVSGGGGKSGLLVLIERKTRFTVIEKIAAVSRDEVLRARGRILRSGRMQTVLSVTTDNESAFIDRSGLLRVLKNAAVYYTHDYASWERGSVENRNRIIRRFYRRGFDFSRVSKAEIQQLKTFINSISEKTSLKGLSAHEAFSSVA